MAIQNVAIVGVTGTVGKHITEALLKGGKHNITALTRDASTTKVPSGVAAKSINYDDEATIVEALKGQDALIITMSVTAPKEQQGKLIAAAGKSGVEWIIPNEYGYDWGETGAGKDTYLGLGYAAARKQIEAVGKKWIGVECGFWYEFSLSGGGYFFDLKEKTATFVDGGNVPWTSSTLPQTGEGVAKILSLPDSALEKYKNNFVYFASFKVTQKLILESILRVTGAKEEDWKITHEQHEERFNNGVKLMQSGDRKGFQMVLYTRAMYPEEPGNMEPKGLQNEALGLSKVDIDTATKMGLEMSDPNYG